VIALAGEDPHRSIEKEPALVLVRHG